MLKKLLIGLVLLIGGFCAYVAMKPDNYRIERSTVFDASPEALFAQANDLRKFNEWSPWAKLDPNAKSEFGGASEGVGASFSWAGNQDVGKGTMTIVESTSSSRIVIRMDFEEPMNDTAMVEYLFEPVDGGTRMVWAIYGKDNFFSKAICVFMDRDAMVGDMYEQGFENLRVVVEGS